MPELFEGFGDVFWVLVFYSGLAEGEEDEEDAQDACYASDDDLDSSVRCGFRSRLWEDLPQRMVVQSRVLLYLG